MGWKNHLSLFSLFSFFSFIIHVHAKLDLHPSDLKALITLRSDLRFKDQPQYAPTFHPCNVTEGVFCERRLSNSNNEISYVLKITKLVFKYKQLTGVLSSAIGSLTELKQLSLSNNQIADCIPPQIVNCRKLEILDLRNNQFSGEVPFELSSLIRLRFIDVSSNKLSGKLSFLKYFPNLETLSIADNHFTGRVPASFCSLSFRNLRHFNYSGNRFLQDSLQLKKRFEFERPTSSDTVPKRRYMFAENESSNGRRISKINHNTAPSATLIPPINLRDLWVLIGFGGALFLFGFIMFKLLDLVSMGRGRNGSRITIYNPLVIKRKEDLAFLETEKGLASLVTIGRGACGKVYKAELPGSKGKMITIKKIVKPPIEVAKLSKADTKHLQKKMRKIRAEINTVGQLRHSNLVPLLAQVSRPDCDYFVYEFMKNGSLQNVLNKVEANEMELDWLTRHKIAVGIATGLEYLHMHTHPPIVIRDLKPANVMLDDDMEAKITDFGLMNAMLDGEKRIITSNVPATVGYIAPEYFQKPKLTYKSDIYSFGVLLAILVIGDVSSWRHRNEVSWGNWIRKVITSRNPKQAIDPKLIGNGYEEQMLLVLKIAFLCTLDNPRERPNSKDVRCLLSDLDSLRSNFDAFMQSNIYKPLLQS